jgi:outer membrane scaffolding protein for murein synthesis (MipA/OmpV family)
MSKAWEIALPQTITYNFYQPWMMGYAGEYTYLPPMVWIDPVIKKQIKNK